VAAHDARGVVAEARVDIVAMWEARTERRTEFVYLLAWSDEAAKAAAWAAFMADEEWREDTGSSITDVTTAAGEEILDPMPVLPRGAASEVVFTVVRRPGVSERELAEDARRVERDLAALKRVLEAGPAPGGPARATATR